MIILACARAAAATLRDSGAASQVGSSVTESAEDHRLKAGWSAAGIPSSMQIIVSGSGEAKSPTMSMVSFSAAASISSSAFR